MPVQALLLFTLIQSRAERAENTQEISALLTGFGLKIKAEYLSSLPGSELHRSISSGQGISNAVDLGSQAFWVHLPSSNKHSSDLRIKRKTRINVGLFCFFFKLERGKKKTQVIQQILLKIRVS